MHIENLVYYDQILKCLKTEFQKRGYQGKSIINENEYLLAEEDSDVVISILIQQAINKTLIARNEYAYQENIHAYREFLKHIAMIIKEISLYDDAISYSIVITRLIHGGYLSNNFRFNHSTRKDKILDFRGFFGMDVINGYGCCRHVAAIHQDIFQELGLPNEKLACFLTKHSLSKEAAFKIANHVVNLICYDGSYYIHDVYNRKLLKFRNGLTIEESFTNDKLFPPIYYRKPVEDMIFEDKTLKEIHREIVKFDMDSSKEHLNEKEYIEDEDEINDYYNRNIKLLREIKGVTKDYVKRIVPTRII